MSITLAEVFPPGEYLRDVLDSNGWTQEECAEIIGKSYMENAYRLSLAEPVSPEIERRARLRAEFPVRELQKRGWILRTDKVDELESAVYNFYGVGDEKVREQCAFAAKRISYDTELSRSQEAVLMRVRELGRHMQVEQFREEKLRACIEQFRPLMHEPAEVRHVPGLLAGTGVRLVICEAFPGSKLEGLCT